MVDDVELVEATDDDIELCMAWRSNPLIYNGFYTQKAPLTWGEHIAWWYSRNQDWRQFIIQYYGRNVGVVTIGQLDHWSPEIGYYIGEVTLWGQGVGRKAVLAALEWLRGQGKRYCHTTVLESNTRSLRLLQGLGFHTLGMAREGELWLVKDL